MGLAGIPWWTTDIGGFMTDDVADADFRELLLRWFEFAVFSPILQSGQRERKVYLPAGTWKNIVDSQTYEGGQTIVCPAPLEWIPVFEKSI